MANKPQKPRKTMSDLWDDEVNRIDRMKRKAIEDGYIINAPIGEKPEKVSKADLQRLRSITEQSVTKLKFANRDNERDKGLSFGDFKKIVNSISKLDDYIKKLRDAMPEEEAEYFARLRQLNDVIENAEKRGYTFNEEIKEKIKNALNNEYNEDFAETVKIMTADDLYELSTAMNPYSKKEESGTEHRKREAYANLLSKDVEQTYFTADIIRERLAASFADTGRLGEMIHEELANAIELDGEKEVYKRLWNAGDHFLNFLDYFITYQGDQKISHLYQPYEFIVQVIRGTRTVIASRITEGMAESPNSHKGKKGRSYGSMEDYAEFMKAAAEALPEGIAEYETTQD